jgi:hypothetical protein
MVYRPIPSVTFGRYGNTGTIDVSQFSRTGSVYSDPDLFAVALQKSMNSNALSILFGDEQSEGNAIFGSSSFSGGDGTISDPLASMTTGTTYPSDLLGQNLYANTVSPQIEMIARSNLIGKTVTAINPVTKSRFSGDVKSISLNNGVLLIAIVDTSGKSINVTPENLLSVSE